MAPQAPPSKPEKRESASGSSSPPSPRGVGADSTVGNDRLAKFLPAEPWGAEHDDQLAAALAAALVFHPNCLDHVERLRTQRGDWEDWRRDAIVLRNLLRRELPRRGFEGWFESVPIADEDRTASEQMAVDQAERSYPWLMARMRPKDVLWWRGRAAAYERWHRR